MIKVLGVIPARYGSTRFPGKVLAPVNGKPMVQVVWEQAKKAKKLDQLVVATEDQKVAEVVRRFGGDARITARDLTSGTDRVWQVAKVIPSQIVLNIQGDEPLLQPEMIDSLVQGLDESPIAEMATLKVPMNVLEGYSNPNIVKVVTDQAGWVLYFSRSPIPARKDDRGEALVWYKHIGLYAYRRSCLEQFVNWPPSSLEKMEGLEQLRAMEHGVRILALDAPADTVAVDTPEDLKRVEMIMKKAAVS